LDTDAARRRLRAVTDVLPVADALASVLPYLQERFSLAHAERFDANDTRALGIGAAAVPEPHAGVMEGRLYLSGLLTEALCEAADVLHALCRAAAGNGYPSAAAGYSRVKLGVRVDCDPLAYSEPELPDLEAARRLGAIEAMVRHTAGADGWRLLRAAFADDGPVPPGTTPSQLVFALCMTQAALALPAGITARDIRDGIASKASEMQHISRGQISTPRPPADPCARPPAYAEK
jgi:hypothetical protein